jgi:hypothetical protein
MNLGRELDVAGPTVGLERAKNLAVDLVQRHGHHGMIPIEERIVRQSGKARMI